MDGSAPFVIAIMGPTASGKSDVAEELAARLGSRIVNADAFQVYRGLDIGTHKPTDRSLYELIDILEPWEPFTAGRFVKLARPICVREAEHERHCVVCGGTGLYVRALFEEYEQMTPPPDPKLRQSLRRALDDLGAEELLRREGLAAAEIEAWSAANPIRVLRMVEKRRSAGGTGPPQPAWLARRVKFGLCISRQVLSGRIEKRLEAMVQNGWLQEAQTLLERGASLAWPAFRAIGYREISACVLGELTLDTALERILVRTRQYAKRQMTWLRKEPSLNWVEAEATAGEVAERILLFLEKEYGNG